MEKTSTAQHGRPVATGQPMIHLILQGKGGVGKSMVAAILGQFLRARGLDVRCIDTDPVNQTLTQYTALHAEHLKLMSESRIDSRVFDQLMERMLTESATFVVDNGASTFIPLWHYVIENGAIESLEKHGRRVYVHSVITGGQAMVDTLSGFNDLASTTPAQNLVVWINEYFGPVEMNGKRFSEMKVFDQHSSRIRGVVSVPRRSADTFGRDIEQMLSSKLTFDEAISGREFSIMGRQRLELVRRELWFRAVAGARAETDRCLGALETRFDAATRAGNALSGWTYLLGAGPL